MNFTEDQINDLMTLHHRTLHQILEKMPENASELEQGLISSEAVMSAARAVAEEAVRLYQKAI